MDDELILKEFKRITEENVDLRQQITELKDYLATTWAEELKSIRTDINLIWKELEYCNRTNAELRQQVAELKNQRMTNFTISKMRIRQERLEIIWNEAKLKGSLDYRDVMNLLSLKYKMSAYRLMEQAEDLYPDDLIIRSSSQGKNQRLIWREG